MFKTLRYCQWSEMPFRESIIGEGYKILFTIYFPFSIPFSIASSLSVMKNIGPLPLYHTIPTFNNPEKEAFKNIVGKRINAGNQHFLLFPQCFLPFKTEIIIRATFILSSANAMNLVTSKILSFGKELKKEE